MEKQKIINSLKENHNSFTNYINELTPDEYLFKNQQSWSAEEQLEHIILCVKPLLQVFSMEKTLIEKNFGKTERQSRTYELLLPDYLEKLTSGGKAPERFVPKINSSDQKEALIQTLTKTIKELCLKIETFNEQELDTLLVPHPLLGNLTLREMLYNTMYHVSHHHQAAKQNLKQK